MKSRKILMPVRTVAEWGGVHEWTVDAAKAIIAEGHSVTFVGEGDLFASQVKLTGAKFIEISWSSWEDYVDVIVESGPYDLIFSHAPQGRQLGLTINKQLQAEHIVMIHGAYHDFMYQWSHEVDAFLAASPSLVHFVQRFGRVEPWKVLSVPNAVDDTVFDLPFRGLEEKLENGVGRIVTASRLSKDKVAQVEAVEEALPILRKQLPEINWKIDVYGDGPLRAFYEHRYRKLTTSLGASSFEMHGWLPANEVPGKMNEAFLTVTAGMAGVRAVASGSLCLGVGARNNVGIQYGQNLRAGLWSNFGDHGIFGFTTPSLAVDLVKACSSLSYENMIKDSRETLRRTNSQQVVNSKMLAALHL